MRDAIVYGYDWEGASTTARMALARAGATVLNSDSASSVFRRKDSRLRQLEPNLYTFRPQILASRLNRYPGMPRM